MIIEVSYLVIFAIVTSIVITSLITTLAFTAKIQKTVFKAISHKFYTENAYRNKISKGMKTKIIEDITANSPIAGVINSMFPGTKEYLINNPDSIETALEYIDLIQKRFPDLTDKVTSLLANVGEGKLKKPIDVSPNYPYSQKEIT